MQSIQFNVNQSLRVSVYPNVLFCVILIYFLLFILFSLPLQAMPFPVKPGSHMQLYDPSLLVHSAFSSHGMSSAAHSSISEKKNELPR